MKNKISKRVLTPTIYGMLAGGFLVFPALWRAAVEYNLALRYHQNEYRYELGNGVEPAVAVRHIEQKAKRAVNVWLKRTLGLRSLWQNCALAALLLCATNFAWVTVVKVLIISAIVIFLAAQCSVWVMIMSARQHCYDALGVVKEEGREEKPEVSAEELEDSEELSEED